MNTGSHITLLKMILRIFQISKKMMYDFLDLLSLEAELARRNIKKIVFFSILLLIGLMSIWILSLGLLILYLHELGWNIELSFLVIIGCHIFFVIIAIIIILKSIPQLTFPVTRKQLFKLKDER